MIGPAHKFYDIVAVVPAAEDLSAFSVALDGKLIKTPAKNALVIPHRRLAEAVAAEWRGRQGKIELSSLPLTRLSMAVQDHVLSRMKEIRAEVLAYARTDLLCYRASEPAKLAQAQDAAWQPHLDWLEDTLGARLHPTRGLIAVAQDESAIAALAAAVGRLDPYRLLVLHSLTARYGSLVLALAVIHQRATAEEALQVSRLEERFQAEFWGTDDEAERRNAHIAREVGDLARLLTLLD